MNRMDDSSATREPASDQERVYLEDLAARVRASWPASLPREAVYPIGRRPLTEHVRHWAKTKPHETAIVYYGREITFSELDQWSDAVASWLVGKGVEPGDRVAIYMGTCPQYTIAFLGILKAHALAVPISAMAKEMEVAHYLADSGAQVVFAQDVLLETLRGSEAWPQVTLVAATAIGDLAPRQPSLPTPPGLTEARRPFGGAVDLLEVMQSVRRPQPPPAWDQWAVINYTGGTTGLPKGCIHSHGDLVFTGANSLTFNVPSPEPHVFCSFLPSFWIGGEVTGILHPLVSGSAIVLLSRWDPLAVMAAIDRYRVTTIALMVDGAVEIMEHPERDKFDLGSLRNTLAVSFVKVLNPEHRARWKASVGTTLRESAWGMTETNTMDTFTTGFQDEDFDLSGPPTFVGLPMPETEFKIVDPESGELLPLGSEGELCVRTPSLFKGYWNKPVQTAEALRGGWLHTSDTAVIDERGLITFRGRRRDMLKVNGMSVFPSEVEALLMRHPALAACCVTGRPDPAKGQVPVAFVQLKPGAGETAESLSAWCRANIASYKVPEIRLRDSLPMTPTGKVKRDELKVFL